MKETAVTNRNGSGKFFSDGDMQNKEWGGGILPSKVNKIAIQSSSQNISLIRLVDFLNNVVAMRRLPMTPTGEGPPRVLMKMDIEGSELEVLTDMVITGALQYVSLALIEFHPLSYQKNSTRQLGILNLKKSIATLQTISKNLNLSSTYHVASFDDEHYYNSSFALPNCSAN